MEAIRCENSAHVGDIMAPDFQQLIANDTQGANIFGGTTSFEFPSPISAMDANNNSCHGDLFSVSKDKNDCTVTQHTAHLQSTPIRKFEEAFPTGRKNKTRIADVKLKLVSRTPAPSAAHVNECTQSPPITTLCESGYLSNSEPNQPGVATIKHEYPRSSQPYPSCAEGSSSGNCGSAVEVTPQYSSFVPQKISVTPQYPSVTPQYPSARLQYPSVTPEYPSVTQRYPSVTPHYFSVTPFYSSVTPQYPLVTQQVPSLTPQDPSVTLRYPSATRQFPSVTPQYSSSTSQYPFVTPLYPPVTPHYSPITPRYPAMTPQYPSVTSQYPPVTTQYPSVTAPYLSVTTQYPSVTSTHAAARRQYCPVSPQYPPFTPEFPLLMPLLQPSPPPVPPQYANPQASSKQYSASMPDQEPPIPSYSTQLPECLTAQEQPPVTLHHTPPAVRNATGTTKLLSLTTQYPSVPTQHSSVTTQYPPVTAQYPSVTTPLYPLITTPYLPVTTQYPPVTTQDPPVTTQHATVNTRYPVVTAKAGQSITRTTESRDHTMPLTLEAQSRPTSTVATKSQNTSTPSQSMRLTRVPRTPFKYTAEQRVELERQFLLDPFCRLGRKTGLSNRLGLEPEAIVCYFKNMRNNTRRRLQAERRAVVPHKTPTHVAERLYKETSHVSQPRTKAPADVALVQQRLAPKITPLAPLWIPESEPYSSLIPPAPKIQRMETMPNSSDLLLTNAHCNATVDVCATTSVSPDFGEIFGNKGINFYL